MRMTFLACSTAMIAVATFLAAPAKAQLVIHPPGFEMGEHYRHHEHGWHPYRYDDHDRDRGGWWHHRHHHHDDDEE